MSEVITNPTELAIKKRGYMLEWRKRNKKEIVEYNKKYRNKNNPKWKESLEKRKERDEIIQKNWRNRNSEHLKEYQKYYVLKNKEKTTERSNKSSKTYYKNNENKKKVYSRTVSLRAVIAGKIKKQPCEVCGGKKSQIHHPDYSKPLNIIWLCKKHHYELHREQRTNNL